MSATEIPVSYPVSEAIKAQNALRDIAGLPTELLPISAFVGIISDEIEILRSHGVDDKRIAEIIELNSSIKIEPSEIAAYYASPDDRHQPED